MLVLTLDRNALEDAGPLTPDRIIKELPLNFGPGVSENPRAQTGGAGNIVYGNTVVLRGIGPCATLVPRRRLPRHQQHARHRSLRHPRAGT